MRGSFVSCLLLVAAAGCGGGDGLQVTPKDMATPDLTAVPDLSAGPDLAKTVDMAKSGLKDMSYVPVIDANGVACGAQTCMNGQKCCASVSGQMLNAVCANACDTDGGQVVVTCSGPGNCGGNPCCGTFSAGGGGAGINGVECAASTSDCVPTIDINSRSGQTRFCAVDGDCTVGAPNAQLNKCCTLKQSGASIHVCLSDLIAQFGGQFGITATCP